MVYFRFRWRRSEWCGEPAKEGDAGIGGTLRGRPLWRQCSVPPPTPLREWSLFIRGGGGTGGGRGGDGGGYKTGGGGG